MVAVTVGTAASAGSPAAKLLCRRSTQASGCTETPVVRLGGSSWFATLDWAGPRGHAARIYVRVGRRWMPAGVLKFGEEPLCCLAWAVLRGLRAPAFSFTVGGGADWNPSVVVSRVGGRWRELRFESSSFYSGPGPDTVIDFNHMQDGLVELETDGSGAAAGPETYQWYRFGGRVFVPSAPPGPTAVCTKTALDKSPRIYTDTASSYNISHFACLDGWALASGTLIGHRVFGLFEQRGSAWLRVAVGSNVQRGYVNVRGLGGIGFATPQSVLKRLAARV